MKFITAAFVSAMALSAFPGRADASVVIDVSQVGADVVAAGAGGFDLTDLTMGGGGSGVAPGGTSPLAHVLFVGAAAPAFDTYFNVSGPLSFGSGSGTAGSSGLGDTIGIFFSSLLVPHGYVSGTELSGSTTFDGQTIASLGMDPGTYVYTWGRGGHADSLTIHIAAIPEPSTWAMMLAGFAGLGLAGWHGSRKAPRAA